MPQTKSKRGKKQQQLVVYAAPAQQQRKKRRRRRQKNTAPSNRCMRINDPRAQFLLALRDPFDPRAEGVRMPDLYRYPTVTKKHRVRFTCTSDASGLLAFTLLPTPYFCLQMVNGTATGVTAYGTNAYCGYIATPDTETGSGLGAYRTVAWGFRILLADTNANAKGMYAVAPVPIAYNDNVTFAFLYNYATTAGVYPTDYMGLPRPASSTEVLPHVRLFNAQDLQYKGDFMAVGVPYDASVKDFRPLCRDGYTPYGTSLLFNGKMSGSAAIAAGTAGTAVQSLTNGKTLDATGHLGYIVYASGLPASTPEINIELVYHLEYIPAPTTTLASTFSAAPSPPGSTSLLERTFSVLQNNMSLGGKALDIGLRTLGMAGWAYARARGMNATPIEVD